MRLAQKESSFATEANQHVFGENAFTFDQFQGTP